ncbi:MAG: hypothetical protein P4M15_13205 [Alphaproteobacteria bacterium]|nr:hypothetical protein [Alphaproteobacteria bacterium]
MKYEELHTRYGAHVSQRVKKELSSAEFAKLSIDELAVWLETRAENAHLDYSRLLNNPLASSETDIARAGLACRRWREAEDLAYLVAVAGDIAPQARAS